ncbi:MAG: hypothetical protein KME60_18240 [Cyanomargarita calcarea GSE-NOS-MK-12-04C]|jgi:hypothetical protein|uniref:DUF2808 domain-containing protein n=1 Tax=Cyanomargarita calcarea GSE-NOS-MK-12-04C TaxID=2839659 RepID=A0A951UVW2_9CYAN|nr:hypothetical protein [Cyanomargarita calcarea GSE-NOS-MK-12-04C]
MKRKIISLIVFSIASTIFAGNATAKTDNNGVNKIDNSFQFLLNQRFVKHTFQLHVPKNGKPLSELIIDAPATVAVSSDIDVLNDNGQKLNINVSVNDKRITLNFPEKVTYATTKKLLISLNKVQQPRSGSDSIYNLSVRVLGSDAEISIGQAQFQAF